MLTIGKVNRRQEIGRGVVMGVTYFKRYRMEIDLAQPLFAAPSLPENYLLSPWRRGLLQDHADVKFMSFRFEIDANVFPSLGDADGCSRLMTEISRREGFLPRATWLLQYQERADGPLENCGTIQGVADGDKFGAVQNLAITPAHRGRNLGTRLLFEALVGFRQAGLPRAYLEVTAQNSGAYRLYQRLGFRTVKTVYKASEVAFA